MFATADRALSMDCWPRCCVVTTFWVAVEIDPPTASLIVPRYVAACDSLSFVVATLCCCPFTRLYRAARSARHWSKGVCRSRVAWVFRLACADVTADRTLERTDEVVSRALVSREV